MTPEKSTTAQPRPLTVRGADGRAHLVSDFANQGAARPVQRIRPIVPSIFRNPD